ncbi:MAG: MFS transporter [Sphingomicrobium sp.]
MSLPATSAPWRKRLGTWLVADPEELPALVGGFLLFLLLFTAYMMLRPIRETMGIAGGVDNLQWLFLATFLATLLFVPLFGTLATRMPRRKLFPASYLFATATLIALGLMMMVDPTNIWLGRAFYVWLSVLNLFLISIAWSLMSDVFRPGQAQRLFGQIAAGASLGGLAGPLISGLLVAQIGHGGLLMVSAALLLCTLPCANFLLRWRSAQSADAEPTESPNQPIGGQIIGGLTLIAKSPQLLGIALFVVLLASVSTFLYFEQAEMVAQAVPHPVRQTQLFSALDAVVQALTIALQLFVTGRLARHMGVTFLLTAIPVAMVLGLGLLAFVSVFPVVLLVVVLRRVGEYALARPGREMLFTRVDQEARYKAKNVIDTVVYRGGDAVSAWLKTAVDAVGAPVMLVGAGLAGLWALVGFALGRSYDRRSATARDSTAMERAD